MSKKQNFLITNDDGISAPGIRHLWEAVKEMGDCLIVAPHAEKSGCGLSITWTKPLYFREAPWEEGAAAWSLNGTPADCVKMALNVHLTEQPTMILSGINRGSNAGKTVLYSGTIGGVTEGALRGIPGIAFSFCDYEVPPIEVTRPHIHAIVNHFLAHPLPPGTILNVNFPLNCAQGVKGVRIAKQGRGYFLESPDRRIHPEGIPYYWLGGKWNEVDGEDPESDVSLLAEGYIACVPIRVGELTDHPAFEKHRSMFIQSLRV